MWIQASWMLRRKKAGTFITRLGFRSLVSSLRSSESHSVSESSHLFSHGLRCTGSTLQDKQNSSYGTGSSPSSRLSRGTPTDTSKMAMNQTTESNEDGADYQDLMKSPVASSDKSLALAAIGWVASDVLEEVTSRLKEWNEVQAKDEWREKGRSVPVPFFGMNLYCHSICYVSIPQNHIFWWNKVSTVNGESVTFSFLFVVKVFSWSNRSSSKTKGRQWRCIPFYFILWPSCLKTVRP